MSIALSTSMLSAQNARTWVSALGDDANPGSRAAPCRTFAGALAKTNAGGEIDALDAGDFRPVTITKAITIDGGGHLACILADTTNTSGHGIYIAAGSGDRVIVRNLSITAIYGTLNSGITFRGGRSLTVEHCRIAQCAPYGINLELNSASASILDTDVINCETNINIMGGIATLDRVRMQGSLSYPGIGLMAQCTIRAKNCVISNSGTGLFCIGGVTELYDCAITHNGYGIRKSTRTPSSGSVVLTNCTVVGNAVGVPAAQGTSVYTTGGNRINGNTSGNGPLSGIVQQQ